MRRLLFLLPLLWLQVANAALPLSVVFQGKTKFEALLKRAEAEQWEKLPIGERVGTVGHALVGTPYKSHTLEIDDQIEAPSVNFNGLDCWTFFETSLAFARLLDLPPEKRTPEEMLRFIELDRYRDGKCTGNYLSRLHYLEDWIFDNAQRGLVKDVTRELGGAKRMNHVAREMTAGWRQYRYLKANPKLLPQLAKQEERITELPVYYIPNSQVARIESKLQTGDIISICSADGPYLGTSHVGLAYRDNNGVLRFMHASSPQNHGKVVVDRRLSDYLKFYTTNRGMFVARPLK